MILWTAGLADHRERPCLDVRAPHATIRQNPFDVILDRRHASDRQDRAPERSQAVVIVADAFKYHDAAAYRDVDCEALPGCRSVEQGTDLSVNALVGPGCLTALRR